MGTIRKRGNAYYAEVSIHKKRKGKSFKTKRLAQAWVNEVETKGFNSNATVSQLLEKYRDEVSVNKAGYRWEAARVGLLSRMDLASVKLDNLRSQHISDWKESRLKEVKESSVNREWTLLSAIFNKGIEWGWLVKHPMKAVQRPKEGTARTRVYTEDEIDRLRLVSPQSVMDCFEFALETAMRAGEICKLEWSMVHDNHVSLPAEICKTRKPRIVPLSAKAREIIKSQTEDNPVFGIKSASLDTMFRSSRDKALIKDATFHDTRRTALTRLAKKMPVETLAKISGHRDLRILLNTYYSPSVEDLTSYFD